MNCEVCKGKGFVVNGHQWKECATCAGTGEKIEVPKKSEKLYTRGEVGLDST